MTTYFLYQHKNNKSIVHVPEVNTVSKYNNLDIREKNMLLSYSFTVIC